MEKPLQHHGGRLEHNETYCGSCYGAQEVCSFVIIHSILFLTRNMQKTYGLLLDLQQFFNNLLFTILFSLPFRNCYMNFFVVDKF